MNELDYLVQQYQLGEEAANFLSSRLGRILVETIESQAHDAYEKLRDLEPTASVEIKQMQNKIKWAEGIRNALAKFVQEAEMAKAALERMEAEELDG